MEVHRRFEAASGVLASLAGGAVVVGLLTAPSDSTAGCRIAAPGEPPICNTGTAAFAQMYRFNEVLVLSIVTALLVGVAVAAVWHSRTSRRVARALLWSCTWVLALEVVASLPNIGVLLLPSVVLAFVACACSMGRRSAAA